MMTEALLQRQLNAVKQRQKQVTGEENRDYNENMETTERLEHILRRRLIKRTLFF